MSAYATVLDLVGRYGPDELAQRTDRQLPRLVTGQMLQTAAEGGDLSGLDEQQQVAIAASLVVLEQALTDASVMVNGYVASRYPVPMASVPTVLIRLTCELARYHLYEDACPENIEKRYNAALKTLRDIADGKLSLGESNTSAEVMSAGGAEMVNGGDRAFSRANARGFM